MSQRRRLKPLDAEPNALPSAHAEGDLRVMALEGAILQHSRAEDYVRDISTLWRTAQAKFVAIGKTLEVAKNSLQHGDYERMVRTMLPFSERTAYQLRMAAAAIEQGRLPAERLPPSYTITYLFSTFDEALLNEADAAGLIRPDVRRAEIIAFKRSKTVAPPDPVSLRKEREKLERERRSIEARLRQIEAELDSGAVEGDAS